MTVNQRLRIMRKEKGITTTALAEKIHVSQSSIVRYENGSVQYIPTDVLEKIASVFSCTVFDLTEGDDRYPQPENIKKASSKSFSSEERSLIMKYRNLPEDAKKIVRQICDLHFDNH